MRRFVFSIKYYENTSNYYSSFCVNNDEIHITQSAAFADYLRRVSNSSINILGYKSFVTALFEKWNHPHTEVYLKSKIRDFLKQKHPYEHWSFYEKRVEEYYSSFLFVVELGGVKLVSDDSLSLNQDQKLLLLLVEELLKDEYVVDYFRERAMLSKSVLATVFNVQNPIEKIYVHHFDYIDAGRMMLFHLFDQIGIKVIFMIPYNSTFPELFKSWKMVYESFPVKRDLWQKLNSGSTNKGLKFASYVDSKPIIGTEDDRTITFDLYTHPTEFKEFLIENPIMDNKNDVITIFDENLNRYASLTKNDSFYSLRYGQFFLAIQNCEKTTNGIRFSYDDFVNLLTSGWVQSGGVNGEKALSLLIDLRSYLEDVESFPDLLDRLQRLIEFQEMGQIYDDLAKEQAGRNKLKQYLANPFRAFPQMHMSRYSITIRQLIECTKDLARKMNKLLLELDEKRNVKEYIQDLLNIYQSVNNDWLSEAKEKFEVLNKVTVPEDWTFGKEELFQFLSFYLGKKSNNHNIISNFDQLIGKVLHGEDIHVTGLSFKTFPWKAPELPSLLTHTWLKKSILTNFISQNRERRLNALVVDFYSRKVTRHTAIYSIYHLLAYAKGNVTLSFIEDLNEKDGPSIYYTILEELYKTDKVEMEKNVEKWDWEEPTLHEKPTLSKELFGRIPDLLWLDSDFCKKKFFMNAIIEQHPIYEQDFHQQQVFATIGKLLAEQGDGIEEVRETLYPLFPQWTNSLKDNLIDTSSAKGLREYKSHENMYYPAALRRVQTLFSRYEVTKNWKASEQYNKNTFKLNKHLEELEQSISVYEVEAQSGHHCRMCPFLTVCKEGEYVIDGND